MISLLSNSDVKNSGAGESARSGIATPSGLSGAPHISHSRREGWFANVQRGQAVVRPFVVEGGPINSSALLASCENFAPEQSLVEVNRDVVGLVISRCVADAMAALRITASGGLIPQAKHGGNGVAVVAVEGSKFEGIGFEYVHIGQTQVTVGLPPSIGRGDGLTVPEIDTDEVFCGGADTDLVVTSRPKFGPGNLLERFGYMIIFGDDLRNPACVGCQR